MWRNTGGMWVCLELWCGETLEVCGFVLSCVWRNTGGMWACLELWCGETLEVCGFVLSCVEKHWKYVGLPVDHSTFCINILLTEHKYRAAYCWECAGIPALSTLTAGSFLYRDILLGYLLVCFGNLLHVFSLWFPCWSMIQ